MTGADDGDFGVWRGIEIFSWRSGVGIVTDIRRDGNRVRFNFLRPGECPEDLWLAPQHFDQRLLNGDWARVSSVGEGPPEPDWEHSEIWRIVPPRDEPPQFAVHIEPTLGYRSGETMVNVHLGGGRWFSRLKASDRFLPSRHERGGWHLPTARPQEPFSEDNKWSDAGDPPLNYNVETVLDSLYAAWRLARNMTRDRPELFES